MDISFYGLGFADQHLLLGSIGFGYRHFLLGFRVGLSSFEGLGFGSRHLLFGFIGFGFQHLLLGFRVWLPTSFRAVPVSLPTSPFRVLGLLSSISF